MSLSYWVPSDMTDFRRFFDEFESAKRRSGTAGPTESTLIPKLDLVEGKVSCCFTIVVVERACSLIVETGQPHFDYGCSRLQEGGHRHQLA